MTKFYEYNTKLFDVKDGELDNLVFYTSKDIINNLGTYEINGNIYRWCIARRNDNGDSSYIGVKLIEVDMDNEEEEYTEFIKCPICGNEEYDSWEYDEDEGNYECCCGAVLEYVRNVTVKYSTEVKTKPEIIKVI